MSELLLISGLRSVSRGLLGGRPPALATSAAPPPSRLQGGVVAAASGPQRSIRLPSFWKAGQCGLEADSEADGRAAAQLCSERQENKKWPAGGPYCAPRRRCHWPCNPTTRSASRGWHAFFWAGAVPEMRRTSPTPDPTARPCPSTLPLAVGATAPPARYPSTLPNRACNGGGRGEIRTTEAQPCRMATCTACGASRSCGATRRGILTVCRRDVPGRAAASSKEPSSAHGRAARPYQKGVVTLHTQAEVASPFSRCRPCGCRRMPPNMHSIPRLPPAWQ
eukprot:355915-Chlamydomonas_euryale.AAC.14